MLAWARLWPMLSVGILWAALTYPPQIHAAELKELYEAEVPISQQDNKAFQDAVQNAFGRVLVKLTGKNDVRANALLGDASRLVEEYGYRSGKQGNLLLWVRFQPDATDKLVRGQGLALWGRSRPTLLVWLAVDEQGQRYLAGAGEHPEIQDVMTEQGQTRGLPVLFPLLDIEDRAQIRLGDVLKPSAEVLRHASQRYQPQAVLAGHISQGTADAWAGEWTLFQAEDFQAQDGQAQDGQAQDGQASWRAQGSLDQVLRSGMDGAADRLAQHFAHRTAHAAGRPDIQEVQLKVSDVKNFEDFSRVSRYLTSLNAVSQVQARLVDPSSVTFDLKLRGDPQGLRQDIAMGRVLAPAEGAAEDALQYRLMP